MDQRSIGPRLNAFGHYLINMDVPLLVTLQHCWDAFVALAPIAGLAFLTLLLTQNKK